MVKEKVVKKKVKKESLSMKEALGSMDLEKAKVVEGKKFNIRDFLWNYPVFFVRVFKKLIPFSYIIFFSIIGVLLSLLLQSSVMANLLSGDVKNNTFTEGCVGSVSTLNPLFMSVNDVDESIQSLVFEKLVDLNEEGKPVANIASKWSVSKDGLIYDFDIKENL